MWSDVDGLTIHARYAGGRDLPEPAVVLVHGLGMSSRYMVPLIRALAGRAVVYAPDLPGYGRSMNPVRRLRLSELASALDSWMEVAGIEHAVVVGNSLGAQLVAQLALRNPGRVATAVLVGSTRDPRSGGPATHLVRLALDGLRERPSLPVVAVVDYLRAGPRLMLALFREALRAPEEAQLAALRVPTVVVRGERDPISTQRWNEQIVALVPGARLVVVPRAAHAVNYSAPEPLAEIILDLTAELARD